MKTETPEIPEIPVLGELVKMGDYITRSGELITIDKYDEFIDTDRAHRTKWPWMDTFSDETYNLYGLNGSTIALAQVSVTQIEKEEDDLIKRISPETHPEEYI